MIDFIFKVDFSTAYIITRRDYSSPIDNIGILTSPVGSGFYYTVESANEDARQHCLAEAARGLSFMSDTARHGQKDNLYQGGCVTRSEGRDRFEVQVKKLRARGRWTTSTSTTRGTRTAAASSRGSLSTADRKDPEMVVVSDDDDDDDGGGLKSPTRGGSALARSKLWGSLTAKIRRKQDAVRQNVLRKLSGFGLGLG